METRLEVVLAGLMGCRAGAELCPEDSGEPPKSLKQQWHGQPCILKKKRLAGPPRLPALESHSLGCSSSSSPVRTSQGSIPPGPGTLQARDAQALPGHAGHAPCESVYAFVSSKRLAHVIMEAGKSKICRVGCGAGHPQKSQCSSSSSK